jgi:hypothetical protein
MSLTTKPTTRWTMAGHGMVMCNCAWGCPCQFDAIPTSGRCEGTGIWEIERGEFGTTKLDGLRFAMLAWFPGPIHEGNGHLQYVIDERTTADQRTALATIFSGTCGGGLFEIFSSVCPTVAESVYAPIELTMDRERRVGSVRIPGVLEGRTEPIRNPVTGEEHRARIVLPGGFEYTEAEVANAVAWRVTSRPPFEYGHEGSHAHLNRFEWTNA